MDTKTDCNALRDSIRETGQKVKDLSAAFKVAVLPEVSDRGEMIANTILAYRHLEDARMRLGKAIQAYEGREWARPPAAA